MKKRIKPAPDKRRPGKVLRVIDPITGQPLPRGGAEKTVTVYWLRRLECGDALEAEPPKPARKPKREAEREDHD